MTALKLVESPAVWVVHGFSGQVMGLNMEAAMARLDAQADVDRRAVRELLTWAEIGLATGSAEAAKRREAETRRPDDGW